MHLKPLVSNNKENVKMAGYTLKKIPQDIYKFILSEQNKLKQQRGTNSFSYETALYSLLREHPKFIEFKNKQEQQQS